MKHIAFPTDHTQRISLIVWIAGVGLFVALAAFFAFKVPVVCIVVSYGVFIALMFGYRLLYGSHGGHGHQTRAVKLAKTKHMHRSGGCH